jgi:hypothetical protein
LATLLPSGGPHGHRQALPVHRAHLAHLAVALVTAAHPEALVPAHQARAHLVLLLALAHLAALVDQVTIHLQEAVAARVLQVVPAE